MDEIEHREVMKLYRASSLKQLYPRRFGKRVSAFDGNFAAVKDQISSVDRHDIDGGLAYIRSNSRRKKRYDRPVIFETLI